MSDQPSSETEVFKLTRTFDAAPPVVWAVWTEADHLAKWFGPAGLKLVVRSLDLTPGGTFLYGMQMPTGVTMWGKWVFRAIEKPVPCRPTLEALNLDSDLSVPLRPRGEGGGVLADG